MHVLYQSRIVDQIRPNRNSKFPYLLQINDLDGLGYFYIKWDQKDLEKLKPYQEHLNQMILHILSLEKGQKFEKEPKFNKEEGWALLQGNPYTVISLSGDGFLFGFALKNRNMWRNLDFNSYIQRVKWWTDQ